LEISELQDGLDTNWNQLNQLAGLGWLASCWPASHVLMRDLVQTGSGSDNPFRMIE